MRVFLAGGTGAVGRALVPLLVGAGHDVVGTSRTPNGVERLRAQGATGVRVDVLDADDLRRAVAAAAPDVIVHQLTDLAAADGRANGVLRREGTRNLVEAAKPAGVERIVVQSISWAYAPGEGPADESERLDTQAPEPRAHMVGGVRAMEEAAAELPQAVVLRYGILYGPGTWYAPGGPVAAALAGDKEARFLGSVEADSSVSSFLHVADAASAALAALDWPAGPVNIVDDEPAPAHEWLPELARALCVPCPEPDLSAERPGWARGASNALARSRGWEPARPSWRTGFGSQVV
ncbi:NAD-dependent epimerase/dehydratase family protein [Streptomyces hoynatensis]|uniref:NAD(P)-dependent oxidoreductase n=1 Tax=Streptomyces hoynatensis TaxID=1141874 RepID=A0A3A9Z3J0_9ACTN|nr:NAD(P)-dependent oxidoreductase [Streptomyces hoynatensis]RKN41887.1 NAD(P)-dependent oxidoreductase [Streptomyces hoynatensis]